jgi:ubiquinone biosynthesis protein
VMRAPPAAHASGYPRLALALFVVAALLGLGIVISSLVRDRRTRPRQQRGPQ